LTLYSTIKEKSTDIKVDVDDESNTLTIQELFTPPFADGFSIGWTLIGQGLLINVAFVTMTVYNLFFDAKGIRTDNFSFDVQSMTTALYFSLPLVGTFL
jgi:hypothetical protein